MSLIEFMTALMITIYFDHPEYYFNDFSDLNRTGYSDPGDTFSNRFMEELSIVNSLFGAM